MVHVDDQDGSPKLRLLGSILYVIAINIVVLILLPIVLVICFIYLILYAILDAYLRMKYGNLYGGLLASSDAIWRIEDHSKSIINVSGILNSDSTDHEVLVTNLRRVIEKEIFEDPQRFPKFTSICKSAMGYGFLVKNQVNPETCLTVINKNEIPDNYDEDFLMKFNSSYANRELPMDHQALWEIIVLSKPIPWNTNVANGTQFPFLMRFNHIIGDGFTINTIILNIVAKNKLQIEKSFKDLMARIIPKEIERMSTKLEKLKLLMKKIGIILYISCVAAPVIAYQFVFRKWDENCLHGPILSKDKHMVFSVEKEERCLAMVRDIRKRANGTSFSHILLTAYSASLNRYFDKVSTTSPEFVTIGVTATLSRPEMNQTQNTPDNKFTMALLDLPVNTGESMMLRLKKVKKHVNILATSADFIVNDIMIKHFCGIFPTYLLKFLMRTDKFTGTISIVPGLPEKMVSHEFTAQDLVFYTPHQGRMGVGLSIFTYNNRFQIGLIVDKKIISDIKDVQFIANNIMEQIQRLHQEVTSSC